MATGCGLDSGHTLGDLLGEDRTLPDGDDVNFSNRHTPVLNPSTNRPMVSMPDASESVAPAGMNPMPSASSAFMPHAGRTVPLENQNVLAGNAPAVNAPVMTSGTPNANTITATAIPAATDQKIPPRLWKPLLPLRKRIRPH